MTDNNDPDISDRLRSGAREAHSAVSGAYDHAELAFERSKAPIRSLIVESYELILWLMLVVGGLSAIWEFFAFRWLSAIEIATQTVLLVGLGFVALEIRDRLRPKIEVEAQERR